MRTRWIPLVAAALALAGCGEPASTPAGDPAPSAPPTARPKTPEPSAPPSSLTPASTEVRGLDIRYVGPDGKFRTLRVEDFPR